MSLITDPVIPSEADDPFRIAVLSERSESKNLSARSRGICILLSGISKASRIFFVLVLFSAVFSSRAAQQPNSSKNEKNFSPHDLSGVWFIEPYYQTILPKEDPPFRPEAAAIFKKRDYEKSHSEPDRGPDPAPKCLPPGVPRTALQPFPWEVVMARDRVVIIYEYQSLVRQIFSDGRSHPKDLDPTYMGNSTGKWDGDTFVVDTIGLNGKTWLDPKGLPTSDALHVTERYHRIDHNNLEVSYTIDDPKMYTKPWTATKRFVLKPDWQIKEYVCAENNLTH